MCASSLGAKLADYGTLKTNAQLADEAARAGDYDEVMRLRQLSLSNAGTCPTCGRCPTCGHTPHYGQGWQGWYPPGTPMWMLSPQGTAL